MTNKRKYKSAVMFVNKYEKQKRMEEKYSQFYIFVSLLVTGNLEFNSESIVEFHFLCLQHNKALVEDSEKQIKLYFLGIFVNIFYFIKKYRWLCVKFICYFWTFYIFLSLQTWRVLGKCIFFHIFFYVLYYYVSENIFIYHYYIIL